MDQNQTTTEIRELNDAMRKRGCLSRWQLTQGVVALPAATGVKAIQAVRAFYDFTPANDPYGEHDFGVCLRWMGHRFFWKIGYYAPDMQHGSEDPADPRMTLWVLTLMLADEY